MGKRIRNLLLMLYSSFRCQTSAKRQESTGLPVEEWAPAKRASEACKVCKCHGFSRGYLQRKSQNVKLWSPAPGGTECLHFEFWFLTFAFALRVPTYVTSLSTVFMTKGRMLARSRARSRSVVSASF